MATAAVVSTIPAKLLILGLAAIPRFKDEVTISFVVLYNAVLDMVRPRAVEDLTTIYRPYLDSVFQKFRAVGVVVVDRRARDMNSHMRCIFVAFVGVLTSSVLYAQAEKSSMPKSLVVAISKVAPNSIIVDAKEVDATACQPVGDSPGLVRADFNGDGRVDYAALLKIKVSKEETVWQGKSLREARFSFVLFLDDGSGGYKPRSIRRYTDFVPTAVVIDLQPAGKIRHRETRQYIRVPNPAVMLSFCEKSATTYYMVNDKIRSIPIAD
jgi:hypothetical protein